MKLWILSDLHADHGGPLPEPPAGAEVAVVAGDVVDDDWLIETAKALPTIFVAGNHEFYRYRFADRLRALRRLPGIHFLENDALTVGEVRFIGCTLWTDYGGSPAAADAARRGMNDHRLIQWHKELWQRFLPEHALRLHFDSRAHISNSLATPHHGPTVVVTHHAPHAGSVHPRYEGQLLNRAYFSDLGEIIETGQPELWVHGHVHSSFDYRVGQTRIICNPKGYPGENSEFNPQLLITI